MKIKIVRLMVATCVCVAALTQGTAVFAGNTKTQYEAPPIVWESCGFPFECATVDVPLDHGYDGPQSMVSIALARVPATDPDNRIGSLFINPGGPGGSGVNFVFNIGTVLYTDEVRARFDIVGFDPRGIGRSDGLKCFRSPEQLETVLKSTPFPVTDKEFREFRRKDWRFANLCRREGGEIQDFMTTADVARDLDLLRQAVGDEQLNYAGFSYGSYIGVTYANLFPQRVGAMIVDAVLDPIAWSTGRGLERFTTPVSARLGSQDGTDETVEQFLELCESAGEACAFSGNSAERYAALAERLKAQPLEIQLPDGTIVNLTYAIAVNETRIAMYNPFSWPSFAELLALVESFASAAEIGAAVAQFHRENGFVSQTPNNIDQTIEGYPGVICTDSDNPRRYQVWRRVSESFDLEGNYFGAPWTWFSSPCARWRGSKHSRYAGPFTCWTDNPVFVTSTTFDPSTPYEGAVIVADLLPNSRLLTVDGWGHTTLFLSECATQAASDYLVYGILPEEGKVCTQDVAPFPVQFARTLKGDDAREKRARAMSSIIPGQFRPAQ